MSASKPAAKDNSSPELKARLRSHLLADVEEPRVLDLYCGSGEMYKRVYGERATEYAGVDREKVHDRALCALMDNRRYLATHDITRFNVVDLDAYGCPWGILYRVLEKAGPGPLTVFITDGLPERLRRNGHGVHLSKAVNRIPKGMGIPAAFRFYEAMFKTMLLDVEERYGWHTVSGLSAWNAGKNVRYWGLRIARLK